MAIKFYTINNITNLHVGSGDTNYGVIDNLVQKDVNTCLPTIHSSGVKGALREFYQSIWGENDSKIETIFGDEDNKPGKWKFLSADLLSRPVRSDKIPYFNATSVEALKAVVNKAEKLGVGNNNVINELKKLMAVGNPQEKQPLVFDQNFVGAKIEETDWIAQYINGNGIDFNILKSILGENIVLINDEDFRKLELPVIARNQLENGKSQNLWYEEVVPYDAYFGLFIITDGNNEQDFNSVLTDNIVQMGANASIGYGLTKLTEQF